MFILGHCPLEQWMTYWICQLGLSVIYQNDLRYLVFCMVLIIRDKWLDFGAVECLLKSRACPMAEGDLHTQLCQATTPVQISNGFAQTTFFSCSTLSNVARNNQHLQNPILFFTKFSKPLSSVRIWT